VDDSLSSTPVSLGSGVQHRWAFSRSHCHAIPFCGQVSVAGFNVYAPEVT
jgi:hypothetical protein